MTLFVTLAGVGGRGLVALARGVLCWGSHYTGVHYMYMNAVHYNENFTTSEKGVHYMYIRV